MGVRAYIELDKGAFTNSDDGQTIGVTVPCGCMSVRGRDGEGQDAAAVALSSSFQCAGEMAVSVAQDIV
ncbi:hypothetical protein LXA43DRAFT_1002151 [Ganoderma leucocontextum]|nr:hypothetical protein LXA43DRAFT_1002151 [Ganoderma leucocontextum]